MQATAVEKKTNHTVIGDGFKILDTEAFAPYIGMQLQNEYGPSWWSQAVLRNLPYQITQNLPKQGRWDTLIDSLDMSACLTLFLGNLWNEVFRKKLSRDHKAWAEELRNIRNKWAHIGGTDFTDSDTERALDTMARFAEQMDGEAADKLRSMLREVRYGSSAGSVAANVSTPETPADSKEVKQAKQGALKAVPLESLKSWREVMQPHPDVAEGRYRAAEFAADLAQVARGKADSEYQDPVEFFNRTYITEGMAGLLKEAMQRANGTGGEPVIQLKTAFGGGKTHSMLALYHLFNGRNVQNIPSLRAVMDEVGVTELPHTNVVTIVGTALNPSTYSVPNDVPGIRVRTVWGEIAYQLARSTGRPELFEYVREADKKGVSPGSVALQEMLDDAGPTLILMDELVAYAKKLPAVKELPAGTLDNFVTFIQELTEAAKASKNAIVVASIPESEIEVGGEAGQSVLAQIEHTFGRAEAVWKPVAAQEGFEIVRRRLFLECKDPDARDAVCEAFSQMYIDKEQEYPIDSRQPDYKGRIEASYPIHPEMFDRLYEDWSTLERFQRTRGVLRLMASVIHQLWMGQDQGLLIMPGSLPLNTPAVRDELTRYLPDAWNPIVDKEVDGVHSLPYETEKMQPRYAGNMAARRVARTVLLGSAPTDESQRVRGLDRQHIRLGTVQPGESEALFDDALATLTKQMSYLYEDSTGGRFWYDMQPTLRKMAADKAAALSETDVNDEIERRLRKLHKEEPFAAVHVVPRSGADVPDEQRVRLVVLPPDKTYRNNMPDNNAIEFAQSILDRRGDSPRVNKNMLVFVAPDDTNMAALRNNIRSFLAWKSIYDTREELQLTPLRIREAQGQIDEYEQTLKTLLPETFAWVLLPSSERASSSTVKWIAERAPVGPSIVRKAADLVLADGQVVQTWSPHFLNEALDMYLWNNREAIQVRELWNYFSSYLYLDRLEDEDVLLRVIQQGVADGRGFGYADSVKDGQYIGLAYGESGRPIRMDGLVVTEVAALRQLKLRPQTELDVLPPKEIVEPDHPVDPPPKPVYTQFTLSADIDYDQLEAQLRQLNDEVLHSLKETPGAQIRISLDVEADSDEGFPDGLRRDVEENCRVLQVRYSNFSRKAD